jgi:predicted acetyltransferase
MLTLSVDEYGRDIMPYSHVNWGGERSLEQHLEDVRAIAESRFGRQRKHLIGLHDGDRITATLKLYARTMLFGERTLRASGFGAVFTPPHMRGRGYATMLVAALLDAERTGGRDFAFLYSDIGTAFYEMLGFVPLPSRSLVFPVSALTPGRADMNVLQEEDWKGVAACANALARRQPYAFTRPPAVWEWFQLRWSQRSTTMTQPVQLVSRRRDRIRAYVLGRRDPANDCFMIDDFGFTDEASVQTLHHLISAGAGDLRRIRGWLPPAIARAALPRGTVGLRKHGILMAAPLSPAGREWVALAAKRGQPHDPVWNADYV